MHKQQPQTAYRKDAVLTGTIFENCDRAKKGVLMQDGYKLNRRAGAKISRKNPGIPAAGAERIPGMRSLGFTQRAGL
jgi:G:T/U-mismatch repair DNA glycosylase